MVDAFQRHCVGETKAAYERYVFERRRQEMGEPIDTLIVDVRQLARSCEYSELEDT